MVTKQSDRIDFLAEKLIDEDTGKLCIRIEVLVKQKGFNHSFFVHFRKKGTVQWQSSPLIRNSNFIDMHGLDSDSVYEIRVAVLSPTKEVTTDEIVSEINEQTVAKKINDSNNEKYLPKNSLEIEVIEKFAVGLIEQVIKDAIAIVDTRGEHNF